MYNTNRQAMDTQGAPAGNKHGFCLENKNL